MRVTATGSVSLKEHQDFSASVTQVFRASNVRLVSVTQASRASSVRLVSVSQASKASSVRLVFVT